MFHAAKWKQMSKSEAVGYTTDVSENVSGINKTWRSQ